MGVRPHGPTSFDMLQPRHLKKKQTFCSVQTPPIVNTLSFHKRTVLTITAPFLLPFPARQAFHLCGLLVGRAAASEALHTLTTGQACPTDEPGDS